MATSGSLSNRDIFKVAIPILGTFVTILFIPGTEDMTFLLFPIFLIALYAGAAELRDDGKRITFRRIWGWKRLPSDIVVARCTLLPALGYVRFTHFMPPFGVLLFVAERDYGGFVPFRKIIMTQDEGVLSEVTEIKHSPSTNENMAR